MAYPRSPRVVTPSRVAGRARSSACVRRDMERAEVVGEFMNSASGDTQGPLLSVQNTPSRIRARSMVGTESWELDPQEVMLLNAQEEWILPAEVRIKLLVAQEGLEPGIKEAMAQEVERLEEVVRMLALYGILEGVCAGYKRYRDVSEARREDLERTLVQGVKLELYRMLEEVVAGNDTANPLHEELCSDVIQQASQEGFRDLDLGQLLAPSSQYRRLLNCRKHQLLSVVLVLAGLPQALADTAHPPALTPAKPVGGALTPRSQTPAMTPPSSSEAELDVKAVRQKQQQPLSPRFRRRSDTPDYPRPLELTIPSWDPCLSAFSPTSVSSRYSALLSTIDGIASVTHEDMQSFSASASSGELAPLSPLSSPSQALAESPNGHVAATDIGPERGPCRNPARSLQNYDGFQALLEEVDDLLAETMRKLAS